MPEVWSALGRLHYESGELQESEKAYAKAVALKDDGRSWFNLAAVRMRLNDPAGALQAFKQAAQHDQALSGIVELADEAKIRIEEAARSLRAYRERLDLDPVELARVETRLAAFHDLARKHRVRPEALPGLADETARRLAELTADADAGGLARAADEARQSLNTLARELSARRKAAALSLGKKVTAMMKELAMAGGRCEIALTALAEPASFGAESVEFRVATHPKQPLGALARVASGGELSRLALAIQVVLAEVGRVPTLIFDEVDVGIGGAVAVTVGRMLRELGLRRQVLCVTHLPQVAACADEHYRVTKIGKGDAVASELARLSAGARVEELARMLGGHEITAKTRAHAGELLAQQREATTRRAR